MTCRRFGFALAAFAAIALSVAPSAQQQAPRPSLESRLEQIHAAARAPAVAGMVFRAGEILASGVVGVRKQGDPTPATLEDRWHIGSLTKTFTSTLVARFVERGDFGWDATLGELVGPVRAKAYADVSLRHLLSHRAGLPANVPQPLTIEVARSRDDVTVQRARLLDVMLATTPAAPPGEAFLYSNVGYIVAGAMLEARSGRSWEDLVRAEVIEPLGLRSAGFGAPGSAGAVDQPWGHRQASATEIVPIEPGPIADNPPFLGPAGTLHMSVPDLVRWAQEHLRGEQGSDGLLRAATFQLLHQPPVEGANYALGWSVLPTGRQRVIWHNGSNTMWYAVVGFDPDENLGVALVTNGPIGTGRTLDSGLMQVFEDWVGRGSGDPRFRGSGSEPPIPRVY